MTRGRLFDLCDLCLKHSNDTNNAFVKLAIFFAFLKYLIITKPSRNTEVR